MRIVLGTVQVPFVHGGAELLVQSLCRELRAVGHEVEIAAIPFKWYPAERIGEHMLACRLLDLTESNGREIDLFIGLKFPAYLIAHPRKVLWLVHQHRGAYDLWGSEHGDLTQAPDGRQVRNMIRTADQSLAGESRAIHTISRNVSDRLMAHCAVASTPLYHPPPEAAAIRGGTYGDYILAPSRINTMKRQHLLLEALALTTAPVRLVFCGAADNPGEADVLAQLAARLDVADRVRFLGGVSVKRKLELYADARAVAFVPVDEDYGYVTLEAMLAGKPVITCGDSGGPLEFILPDETGIVTEPTAPALAEALDRIWSQRRLAPKLGKAALAHYRALDISWEKAISCLLA